MRQALVLCGLLAIATPAVAEPIVPRNLDSLTIGTQIASMQDLFRVALPPPLTMGLLDSRVFFDGAVYTYVNMVVPSLDDMSHFNTAFEVLGFTGDAGYSFSDAQAAGGTGTNIDFLTADVNGRLHWLGLERGIGANWDSGDSIRFFFRSTLPPRLGDYNLLNGEAGSAQGFAPAPEPGTMILIGTGLTGLYYRRKRQREMMSS